MSVLYNNSNIYIKRLYKVQIRLTKSITIVTQRKLNSYFNPSRRIYNSVLINFIMTFIEAVSFESVSYLINLEQGLGLYM